MAEIESTQLAEEEFDVHMACMGLASPDDSPPFGKDDQDILETEEEEEEEEEEKEEEEEEDRETIILELVVGINISADEDAVSHEHPLYFEAEVETGLRKILDQFRLSAAEIDETVGSFQNFISATQQICF
jgi:hypothetical protein